MLAGTSIFSQAVDEWKKLSDEEKKTYAEKYKVSCLILSLAIVDISA